MTSKALRLQTAIQSQTAVAKAVLGCVPMQATWTMASIVSECCRTHVAGGDKRIIEGCINTLVDAGIVKEPIRGQFRRVSLATHDELPEPTLRTPANEEPRPQPEQRMSATPAPAPAVNPTRSTPINELAVLAGRMRQLADNYKMIADRIDDLVIGAMEEIDQAKAKAAKWDTMRAMLKDGPNAL